MLKIGVIGYGAIAQYVARALPAHNARLAVAIVRPGREDAASAALGSDVEITTTVTHAAADFIVDCAGHEALRQHGEGVLAAGIPLATVSLGALADAGLYQQLQVAAQTGGVALHLCSGAIGALDALSAAREGHLDQVSYIGRKPPHGWKGSRAQDMIDLDRPGPNPVTHFEGSARDAALLYPKNANVAAAVALAGLGFDATRVALISDPNAVANTHEITARGDFGEFVFTISGQTLPGNPRTSALAAMSVLSTIAAHGAAIRF